MQAYVTEKLFFELGIFFLIASCTIDTQPANQPVPESDIERLVEGKQEEENIDEEDMDMDCDDDDDDDDDVIYPLSPQEEYSTEQETESESDMSATETDEAKDQRCITFFLHNTFVRNNVGAQQCITTLTCVM